MKIGFVLDDTLDKPDGVQQYVLTLGNWLVAQGHEVHYLVTETKRTDIPHIHSLGGYLSGRFNGNNVRTPFPVSRRRLRALLGELKLDVIHVQMPYSPFFGGRVVSASHQTPVIATFHILPYTRWQHATNFVLGLMQRRSAGLLRTVIAPSPQAAAFAASAYGVGALTIPHPIDIQHFQTGRRLATYDDGRINLIFLGRLVKRKGVIPLITAYQALEPELRRRARLIIVGPGPQLEAARRLAARADDIIFTGFIAEADKPHYLASADIAIFPAIGGESFGIVLTEAMAAGSGVVIGGDNAGYSSILSTTPECLFDPLDTRRFTQLLTRLITDETLRHELHRRQQRRLQDFDLDTYGQRLITIYSAK